MEQMESINLHQSQRQRHHNMGKITIGKYRINISDDKIKSEKKVDSFVDKMLKELSYIQEKEALKEGLTQLHQIFHPVKPKKDEKEDK